MPTAAEVKKVLDDLGITVESKFVPFSQSRHKADKDPGLNWIVTVLYKGRPVLTTDYGAGMAHCPSYKQDSRTVYARQVIVAECERGYRCRWGMNTDRILSTQLPGDKILPDSASVISCLLSDADAINYATFEDWASEFGYDTDSRKAEATYRACLDTGLKFRSGVGDDVMKKLREALQDY